MTSRPLTSSSCLMTLSSSSSSRAMLSTHRFSRDEVLLSAYPAPDASYSPSPLARFGLMQRKPWGSPRPVRDPASPTHLFAPVVESTCTFHILYLSQRLTPSAPAYALLLLDAATSGRARRVLWISVSKHVWQVASNSTPEGAENTANREKREPRSDLASGAPLRRVIHEVRVLM
ncbi:hypothetical protein BDV93DRAFT_225762 [Ceratobasidium sp. AG-I]|nr:hypothetical protein BDV93DRAFT_258429 [Ceratobasidium sp. AG-I]KAF8593569.1 hypothetical protein BDV93DRAFT_225762 [Ceratobasidium sp. AG-I]